jgi:hypothetical protein
MIHSNLCRNLRPFLRLKSGMKAEFLPENGWKHVHLHATVPQAQPPPLSRTSRSFGRIKTPQSYCASTAWTAVVRGQPLSES